MCGIAGFAGTGTGSPVPDAAVLLRMCDSLAHRGPDDRGFLRDERVGLGMRRLAVIDVAGGRQPISNEDGSVLAVCNGEIYNFRELRSELETAGHRFRTRTDTEVLVHGYEEWGDPFLTRLNGMFALALYDRAGARVLLARDHVGIKPLYYASTPDLLIWGSEIKALLASGLVERRLDLDALGQFMAWEYCPGEATLLQTVRKLLPGRLLTLDLLSGRQEVQRYWQLPPPPGADERGDAYWLDRVEATLRAAVRRQLVSDVPLGAFLSGGVDSSLITAAMGDAVTFSIGFEDPTYNELEHSTRVARHLGIRHLTEVIRPDALELFDHLMHFMDDPIGDSSIFPTYLVSRLARRHVTVSLSGDGGDELFGGYESYLAQGVARRYGALPKLLRRGLIEPAVRLLRPTRSKKGLVNKALRFVEGVRHETALGHARWRVFLGEQQKAALFTPDALASMDSPLGAHVETLFGEARGREPLAQCLYVDLFSYLPDDILTKVDRMSMAVSLESRVPFLDKEVVELAFQVPDRLKIRAGVSKWILKRIAERHLPAEAVYRPKEGFSVPLKHWLAGAYRGLMEDLLSDRRLRQDGIFEQSEVDRLRKEHLSGRRNHSHQLWAVMMFQAWQDRWLREPAG
ncbi:MAG: asparagine synthase (glutamine-hydrolyzing) [Deferrisomatales bacterium]|nr:asparagine synthase (glutamine-hydrolyzing) [Deferrisomatales bacterium]